MIPVFALQLICGLSTVWTIAPKKEITSGFFRIQMLLVLGLSVLLFLTSNQIPQMQNLGYVQKILAYSPLLIGILAYFGSMAWTLERRKGGTVFGSLIAILSTSLLILLTYSLIQLRHGYVVVDGHDTMPVLPPPLEYAEVLTAAWLIGAATASMLIGHWYLTATGMKLDPFVQYNRVFVIACLLRIATVIAVGYTQTVSPETHWSLLTLRWAGLIGPLIMAILTIKILKYRNTQSATGLLYAATTLVFMGEMASNLIG